MIETAEFPPILGAIVAGFLLGFLPALVLHAVRAEPRPDVRATRADRRAILAGALFYAVLLVMERTEHGPVVLAQLAEHSDELLPRLAIVLAALPTLWVGVQLGRYFGLRSRTKHQRTGRLSILSTVREQLGYPPLPPVPWAPRRGLLARWDNDRGFGFIRPDQKDIPELLVHVRAFRGRRRPQVGQHVRFVPGQREGKFQAVTASLTGFAIMPSTVLLALAIAGAGFLLAVNAHSYLVTGRLLDSGLLVLYLSMSLITFLTYRFDVERARHAGWRVPERRLHLLELLGGWPGGLIAQRYYRHKNRKVSYQLVFWLIVLVNVGGAWHLHKLELHRQRRAEPAAERLAPHQLADPHTRTDHVSRHR